MVTLTISLSDAVVCSALARAAELKMPFERYVENRLETEDEPAEEDDPNTPMGLAKRLFNLALDRPVDGPEYRLEDLYASTGATDWREFGAGFRVRLGIAFKRRVQIQYDGGTQLEDGTQVKVVASGKSKRDQAKYRTIQSG